ncbi:M28 family peptidase [Aurantiacibacter aquimixticola]|uniref:M28 family peptidase n=1 Tax=Aurantiacibacter aquimixticola TaxID=1958945 RepID=A0A419RQY8_9SPHN|nr:M28 family peptidase [Aurantiacibacter aquimixticola]RJY08186.1 M28 family peptidase [Aurantiacibacter aquimixticola]
MKKFLLLGAFALAASATPALAEDPVTDRATLERDVRVLADDDMEGREAGTPGYDRAAAYVASRFADMGLEPGGDDGDWYQRFGLVRHSAARDSRLSIRGADGSDIKATFGEDFVGGGIASASGDSVTAEMVFVGYGLDLPDLGYDDLSGVDLEGKIALWTFAVPEGLDSLETIHIQRSAMQRFAARGAVGAIMLWTPSMDERINWERGRNFIGRVGGVTWMGPDGVAHDDARGMEFSLIASPELSRRLLQGQPLDYEAFSAAQANDLAVVPSFATGMTARVAYENAFEPMLETSNVIAIQPGTDPSVADQYIVVTAHLDHEGANGEGPDPIYNGAMDNATGTAAMLEMARLFAAQPQRRPVMFVALGAEELGLLGSSYHAANPGLEQGYLAANVNVDMPVLTWPFSDIVAFGADRSNLLGEVSSAVNEYDLKLVPDPNPSEAFFFRSDQYSYVQAGIPAVYVELGFGNGGDVAQESFLSTHYHKVSDEADLVDYEQLGRFADVAYLVTRNIANMDAQPAWNAGDFFERAFPRRVPIGK